ncbi:GMC oxidoreductase [Trematosphaeria pertusa]|uniref:GMC oxidoreductase n=1 Tax=Trematosphaeria pertusa TaxID=390896 RepID=A0A6A6IH84_9PLEO|nr:GMC oxidoreductase [Trematosphaeria pertusa]KAF2249242.1 GMC oxidoreductase [Trematosphaeria pertusa]
MSDSPTKDIIIIGGGLAGCVLASRLHEKHPTLRILLIEAGKDVADHPLTTTPLACFSCHYSELDWAYSTVAQPHLGNRACYAAAGKALSGGSATNYGTWTRGNAADYDLWATVVGDSRWNYEGWLPYFRKTETYHGQLGSADMSKHGHDGPVHNYSISASSASRKYPLRERVRDAWARVGVQEIADGNAGSPLGLAELVENWHAGRRQLASQIYPLTGIEVLTETLVTRVLVQERDGEPVATGVELANGTTITASKEVIVSAGAYRTPQVLMLSGIGPAQELEKHGIPVVSSSPAVGRNFHDHLAVCQWWKLRDPERDPSIGSPQWQDAGLFAGLPCDWVATQQTPLEKLQHALEKDGEESLNDHPLLSPRAAHIESLIVYAPAGAQIAGVAVPMDGSHIASAVLLMTPTSRGSITLADTDPATPPVIDANYYATAADRTMLREGIRTVVKVLRDTPEGREAVVSELLPPDGKELSSSSSDAEIDARVARVANTFYHPAGTAAMGSVVDAELRVKGVRGLRVVDASVFPVPITAHYQCAVYALAERAADFVGEALR